jgi:hypothetical protein
MTIGTQAGDLLFQRGARFVLLRGALVGIVSFASGLVQVSAWLTDYTQDILTAHGWSSVPLTTDVQPSDENLVLPSLG